MKKLAKYADILILAITLGIALASCPNVTSDKKKAQIDNDASLASLSIAGKKVNLGDPSADYITAVTSDIFLSETEAVNAAIAAIANSLAASVMYGKINQDGFISAWQSSGLLSFSDNDILVIKVIAESGVTKYYKIIITVDTPPLASLAIAGREVNLESPSVNLNTAIAAEIFLSDEDAVNASINITLNPGSSNAMYGIMADNFPESWQISGKLNFNDGDILAISAYSTGGIIMYYKVRITLDTPPLANLVIAGINVDFKEPSVNLITSVAAVICLQEEDAVNAVIKITLNPGSSNARYGIMTGGNPEFWLSSGNLNFINGDILAISANTASGVILYYKIEIQVEPPQEAVTGLLGKVLILQVFGTGSNTDAGVSHSFIELYNKSNEPADLTGYSLQYSEGGTSWKILKLDGQTIDPGHSFLILGRKRTEIDPSGVYGLLQLDESHADMVWQDGSNALQMSNKSFKVLLIENTAAITVANPFDIIGNGTGIKTDGYVDMLGSNDNDKTTSIDAFETAVFTGSKGPFLLSKGKSARRIDLIDTDDNNADFEAIEWRQRAGDSNALSPEGFAGLSPRSSKDGPWDPSFYRGQTEERNANISELKIAGQTVDPGTPASAYSLVDWPGYFSIAETAAGSVQIEIKVTEGASYRTAKVSASGLPAWGNSLTFSFTNADLLFIEVTAKNGMSKQVYGIYIIVTPVAGKIMLSGTYNLILNSTFDQQQVAIEAYRAQAAAAMDMVARSNADMTAIGSLGSGTWSMQVPAGETVWFKIAVTDSTGYTFGRVVSASGLSYSSNTQNISLTLGPYDPPVLENFTLINADANSGTKRNKIGYINESTGLISFDTTSFTTVSVNTIIDFHKLVANFTVSEGSKLYAENVEQISGISANNYNREVAFTVIAEDNARKAYTVAGPAPVSGVNVPGVRSIVGTTSWQTQGFGVLNITTSNKTLGLPTGNTGKLNIVWNPTGSYTYISPEGRVQTGGTEIKAHGNWTVRFEDPKSFSLKLTNAAGFDYYDYKEEKFVTMPAHKRWVLLINSGDDTRIVGSTCYEMGRQILTNMGWQPHTDWVFLFLNDEYKGLYMLSEVIKIDSGRLNIGPEASASNPNGGFIVEMNNFYWYVNDLAPETNTSANLIFDSLYTFMTSHQCLDSAGMVWSFSSPDENLGWYYADPPLGDGNLTYTNTTHFPRKGIAMRAVLGPGSGSNRASAAPGNWIVPNDFGQTYGMGTMDMKNGGLYGTRTLDDPQVYPEWESSVFVKMSKFIQDAEDAIYTHDWGTSGMGGYHDFIDIDSFIDWHIAHEMASDWEVIGLNGRYMHYDPSAKKLKMGPMWDVDKAFDIGERGAWPGFVQTAPFWYKEILGSAKDSYYVKRFKERWNEVSDKFNTVLDPYIDIQNARFGRITGYSHPYGMSISGNRTAVKTKLTVIKNQLNPIFTGY